MKELVFYGLTSTPTSWEPDAFYYIEIGNNIESYLVGSDGVPRNLGNTAMITSIINANINKILVVNTIVERDQLSLVQNGLVLVLDATGDAQIQEGSATYLYQHSTGTWHLIASYELISNIVTNLEWDYLTGNLTLYYNSGNQIVTNLDGRYRLSTKINDIVNAGATVITTFPNNIDGCFIDYCLKERNNKRVGRLIVVWDADVSVFYTDYSSPEIGAVPASFEFLKVGSSVQCRVISQVNNLSVELLITTI